MTDQGEVGAAAVEVDAYTRRALLAGAAGLTGVVAMAGAGWRSPVAASTGSTGAGLGRAAQVVGTVIDLSFADAPPLFPLTAEGGGVEGVVFVDPPGPDGVAKKHLGNVKFSDITVSLGAKTLPVVTSWVSSFLTGASEPRSGEINVASHETVSTLSFTDAVLTEFGLPALDASSKDAAKMTLKFSPAGSAYSPVGGSVGVPPVAKKWLVSNFTFEIDGLSSTKVSKIDAITIKQTSLADTGTDIEPTKLEVPNLKITMDEAEAHDYYAWHEDFVVNQNWADDQERSGTLTYRRPNGIPVLALEFSHVGILKATPEASENNSDKIRRVTFELYLENVVAKFGG